MHIAGLFFIGIVNFSESRGQRARFIRKVDQGQVEAGLLACDLSPVGG